MGVTLDQYRGRIGTFVPQGRRRKTKKFCDKTSQSNFSGILLFMCIVTSILLLMANIEQNPGPNTPVSVFLEPTFGVETERRDIISSLLELMVTRRANVMRKNLW